MAYCILLYHGTSPLLPPPPLWNKDEILIPSSLLCVYWNCTQSSVVDDFLIHSSFAMSLLLLCRQSSVVDEFFDPLQTLNLIGNVEGLKDVWEGRVITTHPLYGRLQIKEALGLQHKAETLLIQVNLANIMPTFPSPLFSPYLALLFVYIHTIWLFLFYQSGRGVTVCSQQWSLLTIFCNFDVHAQKGS